MMARRSIGSTHGPRTGALDPNAATIRCRCGKRLAVLWPHRRDASPPGWTGVDGHVYAFHLAQFGQTHPGGVIKDISREDWMSLRCPRCGLDWQGPQSVMAAWCAQNPRGDVVLTPDGTGPRAGTASLSPTRDW